MKNALLFWPLLLLALFFLKYCFFNQVMILGTIGKLKNKIVRTSLQFCEQTFLQKKLNNWFGYFFIAAIAVVFGYLLATRTEMGLGLFGVILGLAVVIACMASAEVGLYITVIYSYFAYFLNRLLFKESLPVGVIYDIVVLATFLGLLREIDFRKKFAAFIKTPVIICLLIILAYIAIQLFNPNSHSLNTWYLAIRKFTGYVLLMYISYDLFDSYERIRRFLILIFVVSVMSAIYGCIQQWHGYFNFEMALILADPHGFGLIFINGEFRKFSTMSDPAAFGILMAACAVFYLVLSSYERNRDRKWIMIIGSIFMILSMAYSGTRTANAIIGAGLAFFILLNVDKKSTRIFGIVTGAIFLFILYGPIHGNKTVDRFRSTFVGEEDQSFKVRVMARKLIQPYIWTHPIGGGLGTTGGIGASEQPGHPLANFQPDSSYLKKAVEVGWIGLLITCVFYYVTLVVGIRGFFQARHESTKAVYAASICALFAFYIAEYAQVALGQITDVVFFYPILAIILKLKHLDNEPDGVPAQL